MAARAVNALPILWFFLKLLILRFLPSQAGRSARQGVIKAAPISWPAGPQLADRAAIKVGYSVRVYMCPATSTTAHLLQSPQISYRLHAGTWACAE